MLVFGVISSILVLIVTSRFLFDYDDNKYMDEDKNKNNCSMIDYDIANKLERI